MIYIACPYSSDNWKVRQERFTIATLYTAKLISEGEIVFSPLTYSHILCEYYHTKTDWYKFDMEFLKVCNTIHILRIPRFEKSEGLQMELNDSIIRKRTIVFIDVIDKKGKYEFITYLASTIEEAVRSVNINPDKGGT